MTFVGCPAESRTSPNNLEAQPFVSWPGMARIIMMDGSFHGWGANISAELPAATELVEVTANVPAAKKIRINPKVNLLNIEFPFTLLLLKSGWTCWFN